MPAFTYFEKEYVRAGYARKEKSMVANVTKNELRKGLKPRELFALLRNRKMEVRDIYVNYDPDHKKYFVTGPFKVLEDPLVKVFLD